MKTSNPAALNLALLGPLPLKVQNRLAGRVIDPGWLAAGLHRDIDVARERHHELLRHLAGIVNELQALRKRWKEEDAAHAEALREAVRFGRPEPPDERTRPEQRLAGEGRLADKALAATEVLAEHVERAVSVVREAEEDVLADLRGQANAAQEQRRQAEEQLAAARRAEWKLVRQARWVMQTADDVGGFGQQPAPTGGENPPRTFEGLRGGDLERAWYRRDPSAEIEDLAREALDRSTGDDRGADPTGQVSELVEPEAAA